MVDGRPIAEYYIRPGPARIGYTLAFETFEALVAAGLKPDEFDALPGSPAWLRPGQFLSKCHVLMAYRMRRHIEAAGSEAQHRHLERQQTKRKPIRNR